MNAISHRKKPDVTKCNSLAEELINDVKLKAHATNEFRFRDYAEKIKMYPSQL